MYIHKLRHAQKAKVHKLTSPFKADTFAGLLDLPPSTYKDQVKKGTLNAELLEQIIEALASLWRNREEHELAVVAFAHLFKQDWLCEGTALKPGSLRFQLGFHKLDKAYAEAVAMRLESWFLRTAGNPTLSFEELEEFAADLHETLGG